MVRHASLPYRPILLTVSIVVLLAPAARGQDYAVQDRLDRIERDVNMLQRQVYRGAPPSAAGDPRTAANTEIRLEQLESDMRQLTGRVEELANGVAQLKQRLEQVNADIDVRFNDLGPDAAARPAGVGGARRPNDAARLAGPGFPPVPSLPPAPPAPPGAPPATGSVVPPPGDSSLTPIFGTLTPPGTPGPKPPTGAPPVGGSAAAAPASTGGVPAGTPAQQYNYAFGLVKQHDYDGAEVALKDFVKQHPNDPLTGNAQYWLGETYFARNQYLEAAAAFADGYKRYPKGQKAAETLLDLGRSLGRADQKKNACVALAQLDHEFPNAGAAVKERSASEKKHLGC
jgi:tol-pal system protein YbgF